MSSYGGRAEALAKAGRRELTLTPSVGFPVLAQVLRQALALT
jgi:hypothetical protein